MKWFAGFCGLLLIALLSMLLTGDRESRPEEVPDEVYIRPLIANRSILLAQDCADATIAKMEGLPRTMHGVIDDHQVSHKELDALRETYLYLNELVYLIEKDTELYKQNNFALSKLIEENTSTLKELRQKVKIISSYLPDKTPIHRPM